MINIVYSFIGCFFALIIHDVIKKPKNKVKDSSLKREIPKNIGRFADPLGEYEQYKDKSGLYKTYIPSKQMRRGEKN